MTQKEMLEIGIDEWWADHQNDAEYADLVLDGIEESDGTWYGTAHDTAHRYTLELDSDGNIRIVP